MKQPRLTAFSSLTQASHPSNRDHSPPQAQAIVHDPPPSALPLAPSSFSCREIRTELSERHVLPHACSTRVVHSAACGRRAAGCRASVATRIAIKGWGGGRDPSQQVYPPADLHYPEARRAFTGGGGAGPANPCRLGDPHVGEEVARRLRPSGTVMARRPWSEPALLAVVWTGTLLI